MATATLQSHVSRSGSRSLRFLRHYGEMVVAMYVGMLGLGAVFSVILLAAGTSVEHVRFHLPVLFGLVMAINMTIPMSAWMRHRGHSWFRVREMALAMAFPAIGAFILFWCGIAHAGAVCPIMCTAMLPVMLAVMLLRSDEYLEPVGLSHQDAHADS